MGRLARALGGGVRADCGGPGSEQELRMGGGGPQELNTLSCSMTQRSRREMRPVRGSVNFLAASTITVHAGSNVQALGEGSSV